jgi:hypothetical protein
MAFTGSYVTNSFKEQLLLGVHDFSTDVIKIALYTNAATIDNSTTVYSATNEVSGAGYTAGGKTLTCTVTLSGNYAILDFADISWTTASFTSRGALVYNSSKANKSIFVLDFGTDKVVSSGTFTVQFPTADVNNAIAVISSVTN